MSAKENKEAASHPAQDRNTVKVPLSETIENAHASGDGALEREKDTGLPVKESEQQEPPTRNEAY